MEYGQRWEADDSDVWVSPKDLTSLNINNAIKCQELCNNPTEKYKKRMKGLPCRLFEFNANGKCILKPQWTNIKITSGSVIGKQSCNGKTGDNFCQAVAKEWYYDLLDNLPDYQGE